MPASSLITDAATSRFVDIADGETRYRIHYNDCGSGDETVVMLHGSGPGASGWANFHRNVEPLVAAGYRVVLIDCPGWSRSDTVVCTGSRSDLNARVTKSVLDALGIQRAHLVGNSMSGGESQAVSRLRPPAGRDQGADPHHLGP